MIRVLAWLRTLPMLLAVLLAGCGGREHAELAPPAPLSLLVLDPAEGATLHTATTPVRGKVLGKAILGFNGRPLALSADGGFATTMDLAEGENRLNFDVWPESASGRGSELLPNTPPALHLTRVVTFVRAALTVQFTAPAENAVLSQSPAQVAGMVSEPDAAVAVNTIAAQVDPTGRFTVAVPLLPGTNLLKAVASASGGRSAQAQRQVVYTPPSAPAVRILEPAEGLITNLAQVAVKGTVSDPAATLKVQGAPVPVSLDGSWITTLAPAEGPLTITADVLNSAGQTGADTRHLVIDRTPPRIVPDGPVPDFTRLTQLPLAGQVVDATPCQLWIQEAATVLTGSPATARFNTSVALVEGSNSLRFRAADAAGNVGTLVLTVVRDTQGPGLSLDPLPPDGECTLTVNGRANETGTTVTFTRDGAPLPSANNAFSFLWTLNPGFNSTTLRAIDPLGNASELVLTRTCSAGPPPTDALVLTVTAPLEGQVFTQPSATVAGRVSPASAAVTLNGAPLSVQGDGSFSTSATLLPGANLLTLLARHPDGRTATESRNVIYQQGGNGLSIQLLSPEEGLLTNAFLVDVTGKMIGTQASVKVQGTPVQVDPSGYYSAQLRLPEGKVTILAEATDAAGNRAQDQRTINLDRTPPVVTITSPANGDLKNSSSVAISGTVDDPLARLLVAGQSLTPDSSGHFQLLLSPGEGGHLVVALATDPAGNTGHASVGFSLDTTPPVLKWVEPTPIEGAQVTAADLSVAATVSERATLKLGVLPVRLREAESGEPGPFLATSTFRASEGRITLILEATDPAGNQSSLSRSFELGLTPPTIEIASPVEGATGSETRRQLVGKVAGPAFTAPFALTLNGSSVTLAGDGSFSMPVDLVEGRNTFHFEAANRFNLKSTGTRTLFRYTEGVSVKLDWPLEGMATALPRTDVRGRVNRPVKTVTVNGIPALLDADGITFTTVAALSSGSNILTATATDVVGNTGQASVKVVRAEDRAPAETFSWDRPSPGFRSKVRTVAVSGTAEVPGVASVSINGSPLPMQGGAGKVPFSGNVQLQGHGPNSLLLEVVTLSGKVLTERREVVYAPELPRIQMVCPDAARSGEEINLAVVPLPGTNLSGGDLRWNGSSLGHQTAPFVPVKVIVPLDAAPGTRLLFEAVVQDTEGEEVTGRAYVTVVGASGATVIAAFDDRSGLPLAGAQARIDGVSLPVPMGDGGRTTLSGMPPAAWLSVEKPGYVPVWRRGDQFGSKPLALFDARPTPLGAGQDAAVSGFAGTFAMGAFSLTLPSGALSAPARISLTPFSTQGLPALLPKGWSAVASLWFQLEGASLASAGMLNLAAPQAMPETGLVWVRWNGEQRSWVPLATALSRNQLATLSLPTPGGYALVVADSGPLAPPAAETGQPLQGTRMGPWRVGTVANGNVNPSVLPTVEAINGGRAIASLVLGFAGHDPIASGLGLLSEIVETYTLVSQSLVEPEKRVQDGIAARYVLGVDKNGAPTLRAVDDGLGMELPLWMSRTFQPTELVDGLLQVGFYHEDQVLVSAGGTLLLDGAGGELSRDGIVATFPSDAVSGQVLVRLAAEPEGAGPWAELGTLGSVAKAFQLDVVGDLNKGFDLRFTDLNLAAEAKPLLVHRRAVQGSLTLVVVGALLKGTTAWSLTIPSGAPILMSGGAFAVLVPGKPWDWMTGAVTMPVDPSNPGSTFGPAVEALLQGGFLAAVSGANGGFAMAAPLGTPVHLVGSRSDLGLSGNLDAPVPSSGLQLRLTAIPFRIETVLPAEAATVNLAETMTVLLSTAADEASLGGVRLYMEPAAPAAGRMEPDERLHERGPGGVHVQSRVKESSSAPAVEIPLRRTLSLDGKSLSLVPLQALPAAAVFRLEVEGLRSKSGETAPSLTRRFRTASMAAAGAADLSRILLGYPNEQFNVSVTVPEGAVPAFAYLEFEGQGMGSTASMFMPPTGPLGFTIKAALGERIRVSGQTRDGKAIFGFISRYVTEDGRTTLGPDGGRVEGPQGLSVLLPAGALAEVVEVKVEPQEDFPTVPEGSLAAGQTLQSGLRLRFSKALELKAAPRIEVPVMKLAAGTDLSVKAGDFGNGPVAVFRKELRQLPDGTTEDVKVLMDTAQRGADGNSLQGLGGLRVPDAALGTVQLVSGVPVGVVNYERDADFPGQLRRGRVQPIGGFVVSALLDLYLLGMREDQPLEYRYHSGFALRNWNGSSGPVSLPAGVQGQVGANAFNVLAHAEIYRMNGLTGVDELRRGRLARGRLLATADDKGRYVSVGGPFASALPGQSWIALYALDPRTGETSIDPGLVRPDQFGHTQTPRAHHLMIRSAENPFDPSLVAPRLKLQARDNQGRSQSIFTVGDRGKLSIGLEPGSASVSRGKVSGDAQGEFGAIFLEPVSIDVAFEKEGPWRVDVEGWSSAVGPDGQPRNIRTSAILELVVTPKGELGPAPDGPPRLVLVNPTAGDVDVEPSAIVKLTFSEPVIGAVPQAFALRQGGQDVAFRVLAAGGRELGPQDGSIRVQQLWLAPLARLPLGQTVQAEVKTTIRDTQGVAFAGASWTFRTRGAEELGSLVTTGEYSDMAVSHGLIYAVETIGISGPDFEVGQYPVHAIRVFDASDPQSLRKGMLFGGHGMWQGANGSGASPLYSGGAGSWAGRPFRNHRIRALKVFPGVGLDPVSGSEGSLSRDVLAVVSQPWVDNEIYIWSSDGQHEWRSRHSTLWLFDVTNDAQAKGPNGEPRLLAAVSLGTLSGNAGIGLGHAGGMVGAIRRRGGLTMWDPQKLRKGVWEDADEFFCETCSSAEGFQPFRKWGEAVLAYRAQSSKGYFGIPAALQAACGLKYEDRDGPSVRSATIAALDSGVPVSFLVGGYDAPRLFVVESRLGGGEATATYLPGGPAGLDARMHDATPRLGGENPQVVEAFRGSWQEGASAKQGLLLLVATPRSLRVFQVLDGSGSDTSLRAIGRGPLSGTPVKIQTDPVKMLASVRVQNGGAYSEMIFDLKSLARSVAATDADFDLPPITTLGIGQQASALFEGKIAVVDGTAVLQKLVVYNLDSIVMKTQMGIPLLVDANKFFAGAFMNYNASVLGLYNPPPQPPMPEKLVYSLRDLQSKNNGYPYLRHYYPDLGEMHISSAVGMTDPRRFLEVTRENSTWFVKAEANLMDGDNEIPGAVTIEGLQLSADQKTVVPTGLPTSKVHGDGDMARAELNRERRAQSDPDHNAWPTYQNKFAYTAWRFFIKPEVLTQRDSEMRLDFKERFRVKITFKLYENQERQASDQSTATLKDLEFALKFNANTRVFDVLRGGVWYYDPVVSASDPQTTSANPFTAEWLKRLTDAQGQPIDISGIYRTRLSLTPGTTIQQGTTFNGVVFGDDMLGWGGGEASNALAWIGLDVVQQLLDDTMPKLRRQVYQGQRNTRMTPIPQRFRRLFGDAPLDEKGLVDCSQAADTLGAYGYRMAHTVNAVQMFSEEEAGAPRELNRPTTWSFDPTKKLDSATHLPERDPEGEELDGRILPLVNQHLKNGADYNPGNVLVNYLVAYPRIRNQGTRDNGLYAINTIFTRDLLVGPMGLSSAGFEDQRKAIDLSIQKFNTFPSLSRFTITNLDEVKDASIRLIQALLNQRIVTDVNALNAGDGAFFNRGAGLLQAGLQNAWSPSPVPLPPGYQPGAWDNTHLYVWARNPVNLDYDTDPEFNVEVRAGIMDHLMRHLNSNRVDIYVNGVQNLPQELEESGNGLQQKLDKLEGLNNDSDPTKHIPVIAIYNSSAKQFFGGNDENDMFDIQDLLRGKADTAIPLRKTKNRDAIKLMGGLKGSVRVLWSQEYQVAFYRERLRNEGLPERVWAMDSAGAPRNLNLIEDAFCQNPVFTANGWMEFLGVTSLAPKTKTNFEDEFSVDPTGKTQAQIDQERKAMFDRAAADFRPKGIAALAKVRNALEGIKITLHAHSQGAIVSAVAHTRLGMVDRGRSFTADEATRFPDTFTSRKVGVAGKINLVTYGGAANMLDWGADPYFRSYVHHFNEKDAVVFLFAMNDPFQNTSQQIVKFSREVADWWDRLDPASLAWFQRKAKHSAALDALFNDPLNPHLLKLRSGPSVGELESWLRGDHMVIFHDSLAPILNVAEHNFVRGYLCTVGTESQVSHYLQRFSNAAPPTGSKVIPFYLGGNPKVYTGENGCLSQSAP